MVKKDGCRDVADLGDVVEYACDSRVFMSLREMICKYATTVGELMCYFVDGDVANDFDLGALAVLSIICVDVWDELLFVMCTRRER